MLDRDVYRQIEIRYGKCDIDLFASRLNYQFKPYVSYTPDKDATVINALAMALSNIMCYVFCSFSIMGTVLHKIASDKAECSCDCSNLADSTLVPAASPHDLPGQLLTIEHSAFTDTTGGPFETAPAEKDETWSFSIIRETFKSRGLSEETQSILLSSWRDSTKKQYRTYFKK